MNARHRARGFTLIELLVVIAIIALLVAILLPALRRARRQAQGVVCLSNQKHLIRALFLYAEDDGVIPGTYWQGVINLDWAGRNNAEYQRHRDRYEHPLETSVLFPYLSGVNGVMECPTAQRSANTFFDYTMIIRLAGARTDLRWIMTYPVKPELGSRSPRRRFDAIPLLIEEDEFFYNASVDDGSWANLDQITNRHAGGANLAYLNGSASRFVGPKGSKPRKAEPQDLTARHLRLIAGPRQHTVYASNRDEFSWVNDPN